MTINLWPHFYIPTGLLIFRLTSIFLISSAIRKACVHKGARFTTFSNSLFFGLLYPSWGIGFQIFFVYFQYFPKKWWAFPKKWWAFPKKKNFVNEFFFVPILMKIFLKTFQNISREKNRHFLFCYIFADLIQKR